MAKPQTERKAEAQKMSFYAVIDPEGTCLQITDSQEQANKAIAQQRFERAVTMLYGDDAMKRFRETIVSAEDALKKLFGEDAVQKINERGNTFTFRTETMDSDMIVQAAKEIAARKKLREKE